MNAGRVGNEFRDGCLCDRSRLAFRSPDFFWKNATNTGEPRDLSCQLRAPQRIGARARAGVGLVCADMLGLVRSQTSVKKFDVYPSWANRQGKVLWLSTRRCIFLYGGFLVQTTGLHLAEWWFLVQTTGLHLAEW